MLKSRVSLADFLQTTLKNADRRLEHIHEERVEVVSNNRSSALAALFAALCCSGQSAFPKSRRACSLKPEASACGGQGGGALSLHRCEQCSHRLRIY